MSQEPPDCPDRSSSIEPSEPPVQQTDEQPNNEQSNIEPSNHEHPSNEQPNNPLHGVRLVDMLEYLVEQYGWQELGDRININCFNSNPSIKSSLTFLRKTEWAREKVEKLYLKSIRKRPKS